MDKVIAQHVINGFSSQVAQVAIEMYVSDRIEKLRVALETIKEPNRIYEVQGAIEELRKFLKVRDTASAVLEVSRNG